MPKAATTAMPRRTSEDDGLIARRVEGREHWLRIVPEDFATPTEWFTHYQQFWSGSIDRLEQLLNALEVEKGTET